MAQILSNHEIEVSLTADMVQPEAIPSPDVPFRILLLGDFSGRANRKVGATQPCSSDFHPIFVDRDNLDSVISQLSVELHLPVLKETAPLLPIQFGELDDFHPDRIVQQVGLFQPLMELRQRLINTSTFAEAAAEVRTWNKMGSHANTEENAERLDDPSSNTSPNSMLDQILEESGDREQRVPELGDKKSWEQYLQAIVAPYAIPSQDPQQPQLIAQVDAAIRGHMLALLHHPDFQALEAAWRGLYFLTRRLETGTLLKLYILDLSKAEISEDLRKGEDLGSSKLYRLLVDQAAGTPGAEPWAVVAGNYTFDRTKEDIELLGHLAKIAKHARAPFLTGASPLVIGCPSVTETPDPNNWQPPRNLMNHELWEALRQRPEASYVGLSMPRFLLRLPYGPDTDPIETFEFAEMSELPRHEDYLWGHSMFACLCLLGRGFSEEGWTFRLGTFQEVENLPLHVYHQDGESRIKPCAEALLSERAAEIILEAGFMPVLSVKHHDSIRLARLQSLAIPLKPLSGRWM